MRWLSAILIFYSLQGFAAEPSPPPEAPQNIIGKWQFYKFIHKGEERPPFNPNLILTFYFFADGTNRLHWERKGESGFCERGGEYSWKDNVLRDKILWVNPNNAMDCSRDPDMQVGRETFTPLERHGQDLHLILQLSGEPFIYVWKKVEPLIGH